YALFLGCTVPVRSMNYELSARRVAERLGVEFLDISEFSCCGYPVKTLDQEAALVLAARNLSLAEERNLDICTLCNACTATLVEASKRLREDAGLRHRVNGILERAGGKSYHGTVEVRHYARVLLQEAGLEGIRERVERELSTLRLAAHYGCHYLKPSSIYDHVEDPENPHTLDDLIEVTGAESLAFEGKNRCCGGGVLAIDETVALSMAREKLDRVRAVHGDAVVIFCPLCGIMYAASQRKIEKIFDTRYGIPVLYLPQLLGLAIGVPLEELGFGQNRVKVRGLLDKALSREETKNAGS
ncbi:MAG: CoB--CoM heterodisulfide reductase iron-sulfur subunit B family protein, partial [Deltaproteobacteria bacterium]|nr:CoB--CoM heterodisulfide reductase iron-sulfur subunit B family protein [Deltaproteobacteria bacterium]